MNTQSSSPSDTENREESTQNPHISLSTQPYTAANSGKNNNWQSEDWQSEDWQVADVPGTIGTHLSTGAASSSTATASSETPMTHPDIRPTPSATEREAELMTLIRDLNECNDVLLDKVAHLEEALDKSQTALQSEIDRNHGPAISESRTLSDRHIAQMVTELEVSNQSLKRHQVLNETLQAELTTHRDRVTQLDQDYAQMQQQYADQNQRLMQAESSVRDLRARLQRQQRYTLQFKAALEKCLNVSSGSPVTESGFVTGTVAATPSVAMPKVDNIAPWASQEPAARLDPQLESLIRGEHHPQPADEVPTPSIDQSGLPTPEVDPETEAQLWRDLARVIEIPDEKTLYNVSSELDEVNEDELLSMTEDGPSSEPVTNTTERSTTEESPAMALPTAAPYVPAMTFPEATPAPVVYPLRAQKRISSMSAVDLPTFPRLKQPQPSQH